MTYALTDIEETNIRDQVFRNGTYSRPANWHVALYKVPPRDAGIGVEVTESGYARIAVPTGAGSTWGVEGPGQVDNDNQIEFGAFGAAITPFEVVAAGLFDVSTSGSPRYWGWISTLFTQFVGRNTGDVFEQYGLTLANGNRVILKGAGLPAGVTADEIYYVVGLSGATFQLSLTSGGAAIVLTTDGAGEVHLLDVKTVGPNDFYRFPAGNLDVFFD